MAIPGTEFPLDMFKIIKLNTLHCTATFFTLQSLCFLLWLQFLSYIGLKEPALVSFWKLSHPRFVLVLHKVCVTGL